MACKTKRSRRGRRARRKRGRRRARRYRGRKKFLFGAGMGGKMTSSLLKKIDNFKKEVPLLQVLKDIKPDQRTIILGSLDTKACTTISNCIRQVIKNKKLNKKTKNKLLKVLGPQKDLLRNIISEAKLSKKKELLPKLGGSLSLVLATAIPILLDIARAKKWI